MPKKGKKSLDRKYKGKDENEAQNAVSLSKNSDMDGAIVQKRST